MMDWITCGENNKTQLGPEEAGAGASGRSRSCLCAGGELCYVPKPEQEGAWSREGRNWKEVCWMLLTCSVLTGGVSYIRIRLRTKEEKTRGFGAWNKEGNKKNGGRRKEGWRKSGIEGHKSRSVDSQPFIPHV